MTRTAIIAALAVAIGAGTTGCQDPYASTDQHRKFTLDAARRHTSRPGPAARPTRPGATRGSQSPRRVASSFGELWVNWDWRTVGGQQRALARRATGQLAQQLQANASSARIDATLARDKPGSRGAVAAVDITATRERGAGIVVTREQTYTNGRADLGGRRYRVYRIHLRRGQNGWEVSGWEPQP